MRKQHASISLPGVTYEPPAGWVDDPTDPVPAWMLDDPRTAQTARFLAGIHRAAGARIRRAREAAGMTREQFTKALADRGHDGWTVDTVQRVETGRHAWKPIEQDLVELLGSSPGTEHAEVSFDSAIGANIRSVRMEAGITQTELAARLTAIGTPWTASNVSLIEAGKRKLTLTALGDLCRVFNVDAAAFFGTEGFSRSVAERLRALGGQESTTAQAVPHVIDDEDAADVARHRLGIRVLGRIATRIPWDLVPVADRVLDDPREAVLDALEDLYETRDILTVRDELASTMAARTAPGQNPTLDQIADARSWATRQLIERLTQYLCEPTVIHEPRMTRTTPNGGDVRGSLEVDQEAREEDSRR